MDQSSKLPIHATDEIARSFRGSSPGARPQKLQFEVVQLAPDLFPRPLLACFLTFFVNRAFDVENEKTSEKKAVAKSWCGNWVIWRAKRMGDLGRKERSRLACAVARESAVECAPKGDARDSGASLLGRQYPVRLNRTYAGMKLVKRDARTLRLIGRERCHPTPSHISCKRVDTPRAANACISDTACRMCSGRLCNGRMKGAAALIDIWRVPLRMTADHHKQDW
jgi:hypothetical protein